MSSSWEIKNKLLKTIKLAKGIGSLLYVVNACEIGKPAVENAENRAIADTLEFPLYSPTARKLDLMLGASGLAITGIGALVNKRRK